MGWLWKPYDLQMSTESLEKVTAFVWQVCVTSFSTHWSFSFLLSIILNVPPFLLLGLPTLICCNKDKKVHNRLSIEISSVEGDMYISTSASASSSATVSTRISLWKGTKREKQKRGDIVKIVCSYPTHSISEPENSWQQKRTASVFCIQRVQPISYRHIQFILDPF